MPTSKQQLRSEISNASAKGYSFYVYTLADATGIFYVGKGTKARVFDHVARRATESNHAKRARIGGGDDVRHTVVAYFNDEGSALRFEATLIRDTKGLTNIALGDCVEPIERARMRARELLAKIVPYESWKPNQAAIHLQKSLGVNSLRELYDRFRAEVVKQTIAPTPTSICLDKTGRVVAYKYNEEHGRPVRLRRRIA